MLSHGISNDVEGAVQRFRSRFPGNSQAMNVFEELARHCVERHERENGDLRSISYALEGVTELVSEVRSTLNPVAREDHPLFEEYRRRLSQYHKEQDQSGILWRFPDVGLAIAAGTSSSHYWPIDQDSLKDAATRYIRHGHRSPSLERIMASAMAYQEVLGFAETVRDQPGGKGFTGMLVAATVRDKCVSKMTTRQMVLDSAKALLWFMTALFIGIAAADQYSWWAGVLAGFGAYALFWFYRVSDKALPLYTRMKTVSLLLDMDTISKQLKDDLASPQYILRRLYDSSANGAVWPTVLISLVERACARNAIDWN